jgi:hypothetical protein
MSESEHIQTHPSSHEPSHGHHGHTPSPFSELELEEFHKNDRFAGGMVVTLMAAIFSVGLVLYTIVALSVVGGV